MIEEDLDMPNLPPDYAIYKDRDGQWRVVSVPRDVLLGPHPTPTAAAAAAWRHYREVTYGR